MFGLKKTELFYYRVGKTAGLPSRLCLLLAPGKVVLRGGGLVLLDEVGDDLVGVVHLVEVVLEHVLFAEALDEGLAFPQHLELLAAVPEEPADAGVVRQHEAADAVRRLHVR